MSRKLPAELINNSESRPGFSQLQGSVRYFPNHNHHPYVIDLHGLINCVARVHHMQLFGFYIKYSRKKTRILLALFMEKCYVVHNVATDFILCHSYIATKLHHPKLVPNCIIINLIPRFTSLPSLALCYG
mgnify:CR=1 FL=1